MRRFQVAALRIFAKFVAHFDPTLFIPHRYLGTPSDVTLIQFLFDLSATFWNPNSLPYTFLPSDLNRRYDLLCIGAESCDTLYKLCDIPSWKQAIYSKCREIMENFSSSGDHFQMRKVCLTLFGGGMLAYLRPQLRFVTFMSGKMISECPIHRFEDAPMNASIPFSPCLPTEKRSNMELDLTRAIYMPGVTPICGTYLKNIKKDKKHPLMEREMSMDVRGRLTSSHGFVDSLSESHLESFFFSEIMNETQELMSRAHQASDLAIGSPFTF